LISGEDLEADATFCRLRSVGSCLAAFARQVHPKFCPMQTKVDADALTELEKFLAREAASV